MTNKTVQSPVRGVDASAPSDWEGYLLLIASFFFFYFFSILKDIIPDASTPEDASTAVDQKREMRSTSQGHTPKPPWPPTCQLRALP